MKNNGSVVAIWGLGDQMRIKGPRNKTKTKKNKKAMHTILIVEKGSLNVSSWGQLKIGNY